MNGLSVSELCCLFCCPPCPSHIVAKLAFLPPSPTYKLIINEDQTPPINPNQVDISSNNNNNNGLTTATITTNTSNSTTSSNAPSEQTALQQQQQQQQNQINGTSRNSLESISNFFQMIRKSSRNLCYGMVCAHQYGLQNQSQQHQLQLNQQLHTNDQLN